MSIDTKILDHCLVEVTAKRRWAESVTNEWRSRASNESLRMVEEALNIPLDEQAERMAEYWRLRSQPTSEGRIIDPSAQRQWDAVLAGEPIQGNYSHFQTRYPEASVPTCGM